MKSLIIYPDAFGIKPDTEVTVAFNNLLNTASENPKSKSLLLEKGNYVFLSKYAPERELYITNTISDKEYSENERKHIQKIALDLKGINDLEIDFNNSTVILDGVMTNLVIENCQNVTLKNLTIETVCPDVHKITILKASPFYVTFKIDETSNYKEENGEYFWYGTDYKLGFTENKNTGAWIPTAMPSNYSHLTRHGSHPFFGVSSIKEIAPRVFKARYIIPKDFTEGQIFYVFPKPRKNVGIFVDGSKNIKLENITQRFNYSLGFVAQNSEDISLERLDFSPRESAEVDFCSLADCIQISSCRGSVSVKNCNFSSSGDDCCNVHGIYFKILEALGDEIVVGFGHRRTFGFNPLRVNDTISFVDSKTLADLGTSKILKSEMVDKYRIKLKLSTRNNPVGAGGVIDDITASPDFVFSENTLNRISTRGVLVTTRGRILIENNKFLNTGMSGVLVLNDALTWHESGRVLSMMIRGNAFMNCENNAILIAPENRRFASFVHENIFIENNLFVLNGIHALNVNSTRNIVMRDNVYKGKASFGKYVISKNVDGLVTDIP